MELDKSEVKRVREHMFGTNQHRLIENCGTFFPWWMNGELHKPPPGLKGKKRRKWFDMRAKFRYSVGEIDTETGNIRFWCPQCAGRIRSNLKTRNQKVSVNKKAPFIVRTDDAEFCCPGRVTVPVKYLDRYQSIPYGTTAHKKSYNRRNQIENLNGTPCPSETLWEPRFVTLVHQAAVQAGAPGGGGLENAAAEWQRAQAFCWPPSS